MASAANVLPQGLRDFAAHATQRETWPRLRTYAQSQADPEWSGWAYFLAGYQEFQGQSFPQAAEDLGQAAKCGFSLADYAVFYQASALRQSSLSLEAATVLKEFSARFPQSHLHDQVLALRATALLNAQQAQAAVDALTADLESRRQPALALLLAQAYVQVHHLLEAAITFQNVYYNFPLSSQAKAAADALAGLREQLGTAYPDADAELKMARAEALFKGGRFLDALSEYNDLLKGQTSSPVLPRWQLGQVRCLLRLHRTADAFQALFTHFASPDLEAQRLALLVQVHAQQSDSTAITQDLAQLENSYASSSAYADALSAAGIFYYRQLNWQEAARDYRRLWELFPLNDHARDDGWRWAWCNYLLGDPKTGEVMHGYLMRYPDSPRAPAALYWLGRVEEDQGALVEARALYALLTNRFTHSYYATRAAARMAAIRPRVESQTGANDSSLAPLTAALIPVITPAVAPPRLACIAAAPSDAARTAMILQALQLPDLAEEYLKATIAVENSPVDLRLLLAETYAAQGNTAAALFAALHAAPAYSQLEFSDLPQEVWEFLYPQSYRKLIESRARLNGLDPYLVMGLIRQESAFSPRALSVANARGLMQILPETAARSDRPARARSAARRLYDPDYNVRVGCAYLAELLRDFDGQPEFAMAAYNAGDSRVREWVKKSPLRDPEIFLESIPISATRIYVEQVLRDTAIYRQLLSGAPHFALCSQAPPLAPQGAVN